MRSRKVLQVKADSQEELSWLEWQDGYIRSYKPNGFRFYAYFTCSQNLEYGVVGDNMRVVMLLDNLIYPSIDN